MKETIKNNLNSPLIVIAVLVIISFFILTPVVNMILLGAIIAFGLRPISNKIQGKIKYSSISIILAIILVVIPLILIFVYCLFVIGDFAFSFISTNQGLVTNMTFNQTDIISPYLPVEMQNYANEIVSNLNSVIKEVLKIVFNYLIDILKSLPEVSLQLFILVASVFYFTRDGHKLNDYLISFIPDESHDYFFRMIKEIKIVLKSIFYGHFLTGIIIGIIAFIGYQILGYDYALFFGILTGVFQLIPILGPWPIYLALCISDLLSYNYLRAAIVLFFGFGISLSDMYIRPQLSTRYADIHPLILLIGFLAGPLVLGVTGFIIGPLILGITYAVIKSYKEEKEIKTENRESI
ncbi:AI-2E family transporter [Methanobrevibacter filiformis]|uniref:Putative inner membrane protein n=1 Tax=Methanobrevibacter filiformis TaxID=55758 RepID=A0A166APP5_9EURY|nr:AI-2E family transporter [Methanobrevibacter filiformis]KZX12311.1 putative inner membrane protein [Methanobrevibacter filiformis]